jgi:hypothetical protein
MEDEIDVLRIVNREHGWLAVPCIDHAHPRVVQAASYRSVQRCSTSLGTGVKPTAIEVLVLQRDEATSGASTTRTSSGT